ncbi:MAG: 4-hydroxybenzoate octaprenyltransferase [Gammaproteobacteria bacterium]|nr:4-hydroxybenzoate octaprenyltransferase [Gammaproteobacteria bacterium]
MRNARAEFLERFPRLPDFIALARLDRPIGIYLLLWPTMWGLWFAAEGWPGWHLFLVFGIGAVLTRSAGCVMNDIADRDFDLHVKRTEDRPLAQRKISVAEAAIYMAGLIFFALVLVLTTNLLTVGLAAIAAAIAAIYPFMKRYTYLPQVVLGIAFSMGIPMAFAAFRGEIPNLAWLIATANVVWTVAYDTEYAMVDRDDDIKLGLRSSAILFGDMDKLIIGVLQALFVFTMVLAGRLAEVGLAYYLGLCAATGFFIYQHVLIKDRERLDCLAAFLNNHWAGLVIFLGLALA